MRRQRPTGGVQMFSFLDAMVCTMGALLVLVHAFARHGEVEATQKSLSAAAVEDPDSAEDRESLQWRIAQLKDSRAKTESQLSDARLQLSHVEDHQRRLLERFNQLKIAATELDRAGTSKSQEREQALADAAAAQEKVTQAREALKQARLDAQQNATAYSVVPYEGPNSTHRRPIYIECRPGAIILQPEGIELTPEDFAGFLGPGNPLASALRGIREYWARQSPPAPGKAPEEPYPLMLVRPEGVEAYYAARSALDSWGADFGYELVGSDWDLKFPEPDPQLAELTRTVVADARVRMRELMLATREMARERAPRAALHASSRGGFVTERGSRGGGRSGQSGGRGGGGWDSLGTSWARGTGASGDGSESAGNGNGGTGGTGLLGGTRNGTMSSDALGNGGSGYGPQQAYSGLGSNQNGSTTQNGSTSGGGGQGQGSGQYDRYASRGNTGGTKAASGDDSSSGGASDGTQDTSDGSAGTRNGTSRYGQTSGSSTAKAGNSTSNDSSAASSQGGGSARAGTANSQSNSTASGSSGAQGGSSSSGSPGQSPGGSMSMGSPAFGGAQATKTTSMAKTRGRDWGLPDAGMGTAAATRPILIECHNDRLVIQPESRSESPKEVRLGPKAQESMDEFVADVWQHMKSWGTAGRGLYWRPTLVMDVKPGAADRYAEVKALLADSGMDVHERQPQSMVKQPKKTTRK